MDEGLKLLYAAGAGALLGIAFFAALLWTVIRSCRSAHPVLWIAGSFLFRACFVAAGFILISGGEGRRLLFCLLGFLVGRHLVTSTSNRWLPQSVPVKEDSHHAP